MHFHKKILYLLTPRERITAILLLILIITMAILEMIGVASILPFVAVLTNPSLIETNLIFKTLFQFLKIFGVENNEEFMFALGVLVFILLIISLSFKTLTTYAIVRFSQMREYSIGKRLIEGYLHQPYSWFLNRNSAEIGKTVLTEVSQVIGGAIRPSIELIARGTTAVAILFLLIFVDLKLALIVGVFLGVAYGLIFYFLRKYLKRIGKKRFRSNELRFIKIAEAFGAVKEVKVGGLEHVYIKSFSKSAKIYALAQAHAASIAQLPRYFLEALAFGGILLIMLYLMAYTGSFNKALPVISLYVFAGYRLLPAIHQIYVSFTKLVFNTLALNMLYNDLKNLKLHNENQSQNILSFNKLISLNNINYNYPNVSRKALKNININIPVKSTVGFIGSTGSGKTTMVDIILGLLKAQEGYLKIDETIITEENIRSWQSLIGYVPQHIYLADDTIAANIAFGIEDEKKNHEAVEKASKIANLHDFIIDELPLKYETIVGERGIRLSGGQRQRIGIARALYHSPQVLILDEATSALDNQTEKAVMDALNNLNKNLTTILIAHRLDTVKGCDKIFLLEKGKIINEGKYDEIFKTKKNLQMNDNN